MLAVILALVSAIGYGSSDFAAGLASRAASVIQVTLLACVAACALVLAVLPFAASPGPSGAALAWGATAGASGTLGGIALYLGFRYAEFSVAAPLSAVGTAGFSVLAGLLWGERPSTLALTGIALALPAIVGVSASAGEGEREGEGEGEGEGAVSASAGDAEQETGDDGIHGHAGRPVAGVAAGLIAGACFALLLIGLDRAGSGSGLWPAAAAEVAELAVAVTAAAVTRNLRLLRGRPGWLSVFAGVTGAAGTVFYFYATHKGLLAVVAVLTSLYPASTIVLARITLGERLTRLRLAGLVLAGACVALIAVGGAG
ncbi:MAG TPA: EamA family transporter [Streptosporangiaceae bacterium]|nr:EamA family transporter [Streptosporangiaceae bacterium]